MKLILKEAVDNLGSIGDVVNVRDGYARNFLLARGKALPATTSELKVLESRRGKIDREKALILENAQAYAAKLKDVVLSKAVRVGEEGKLYGSVGVGEIAELLAALGHEIAKKQVLLPEPIHALGEYIIPIRLHTEVTVDVKLTISEEKTE